MSPPPLGERNRQSGWITSHFDSHTMEDHEDDIPEMSSPPHEVGEEYPTSTYDAPHEHPSLSGYDPSFIGCRYWLPDDETHHEPISTIHVRYDMPDIPTPDPTYHAELELEPSTMPRGTPIPFHVKIFGDTSHIAPSIPMVEESSHAPPRPSVSNPIQIPGPRRVSIGNTTYIPSHVPSSSNPVPSNAFLMTHPPPSSCGPSGRNVATSHVHSATANMVISQIRVPPILLACHVPISRSSHVPPRGAPHIPNYGTSHGTSHGTPYGYFHGHSYGLQYGKNYQPYGYGYPQPAYSSNYGFVAPHNQGTPHQNASMQPYMGQMGGGYYDQGHGFYSNQPYMNQNYQGAWNRPAQPRLPFLATLNLPDLQRLMNDPVSHNLAWKIVPNKIPSDISNFEGKAGEDPGEHVTTFHLLCLPIPYMTIPSV